MLKIDPIPEQNPFNTYKLRKTVLLLFLLIFLCFSSEVRAKNQITPAGITCENPPENPGETKETPAREGGTNTVDVYTNIPQPRQTTSVFRRRRTKLQSREMGIGGNLFGPTLNFASAYLQYSFSRALQAESGLDLSTVYAGFNLYPRLVQQFEGLSPYMGLMVGYSDPDNLSTATGIYAYMPVGLRYVTTNDWYICLEFAATTADNVRSSPLYLGLKMGFLFKRNK